MINIEFFNNLNSDFNVDEIIVQVIHTFAIFLLNAVSYFYVFLKFFKVLCYSKLTFEWFPMINPYVWPFSIFQTITGPYFAFWARVLPNIKLEKSSLEVSNIIALESLNSFVFFAMLLTQELIAVLAETEAAILNYS
jgi:hypothetical protein